MLKSKGVAARFIAIISISLAVIFAGLAVVLVSVVANSMGHLVNEFTEGIGNEKTRQETILSEQIIDKGRAMAALLADTGAGLIAEYDFDALNGFAQNAENDQDLVYVSFFDPENNLLTEPKEAPAGLKVIRQEISQDGGLIGYIEVGMSLDRADNIIGELSERTDTLSNRLGNYVKNFTGSMYRWIFVMAALGVVLICLAVYLCLNRFVMTPLKSIISGLTEGSGQVENASLQLSIGSQGLAEGAGEQAASLEETSSSLEEMAAMARRNADNARQCDNLMREANQVIAKANTLMDDQEISMQEITQASRDTSNIIKTIDEIAFQTNLLALNAAVEAARAGEAGAGFAVVADEVRNLATRAANAAHSTAELIESIVDKVENGSELVAATNSDFDLVAEKASKVGGLVAEIAGASSEQTTGIDQINKAVTEIDRVVQHTAANAQESADVSAEMKGQAARLAGYVEELNTLLGGGKRAADREPAPSEHRPDGNLLPGV